MDSLLIYLARTDIDPGARARAEAVVFDVPEPSKRPLALQLPGDARIDAITRAFRAATGLSFAQWWQSLRIHWALTLLTEGYEVRGGYSARRERHRFPPGCRLRCSEASSS